MLHEPAQLHYDLFKYFPLLQLATATFRPILLYLVYHSEIIVIYIWIFSFAWHRSSFAIYNTGYLSTHLTSFLTQLCARSYFVKSALLQFDSNQTYKIVSKKHAPQLALYNVACIAHYFVDYKRATFDPNGKEIWNAYYLYKTVTVISPMFRSAGRGIDTFADY